MSIKRRGLSICIERSGSDIFLSFKAIGKLTHEDYETITPMIDFASNAVKKPQIKALIDNTEFEGWELRAAWDDFKIGLKHGNKLVKIAMFGNKHWLEIAVKLRSWFVAGEVKYFENKDDAVAWLNL